jgi:hypothetical protein
MLFGIVEQGIRWPSLGVLLIAGVSGLLGVVLALLNLRIAQRPRST